MLPSTYQWNQKQLLIVDATSTRLQLELEGRQLAYQIGMPQGESRMESLDDGRFGNAQKENSMYLEIGSLYMRYTFLYIYIEKCSIIHFIHRYICHA